MDRRPPPLDLAHYDLEAAQFLTRCERRAKHVGSAGCLIVVVVGVVLASLGALQSMGGWFLLVFGSIVLFGVLSKQAVRKSVLEFQHTFRPGAGSERRDAALAYLWSRAQGASAKTPAGKAAKELLDQLGIRARPRGAPASAEGGARPEPQVVLLSEAPPGVPVPTSRGGPPRAAPPGPAPGGGAAPAARVQGPAAGRPSHAHAEPVPPRSESTLPGPGAPRSSELRGGTSGSAPAASPAAARGHAATPPPPPHVPPASSWGPVAPGSPSPAPTSSATPPAPDPHLAPQSGGSSPGPTLLGSASQVICESCGGVRTVRRGESAGLCPICYPQIRLDS